MTVVVESHHHPHECFVQDDDLPQRTYEMVRRAVLDRRVRIGRRFLDALQAHGAAGAVIDPESVLVSAASRPSPRTVRRDTALRHAHLSAEVFATVACSLAEGVGVRATARIQGIDKKTVLLVLKKAAEHVEKLSRALLVKVVVRECQLDEMWSFVGKKEQNLEPFEKLRGEFGDAWIWIAFDAVNKLVIARSVGKRTLPHAVALLQEVKRVTAQMPATASKVGWTAVRLVAAMG